MHDTAMQNGKRFFDTYLADRPEGTIVDVGAQDVNGSLRSVAPANFKYVGVDFAEGKGVDVIIDDPYSLPFEADSIDVAVTSSCFEHSEFFWLTFLEILRILKPSGLLYLNAPSNGYVHQYPVDCWRFYPDSGIALQNWARRNRIDALMLESYTSEKRDGVWNDFVAVFVKDGRHANLYRRRIQDGWAGFFNGRTAGSEDYRNAQHIPEDQRSLSERLRRKYLEFRYGGPR